MPGIVGIIGRSNPDRKKNELRRMVKSMLHEPTYSSGTQVHEPLGVYSGWVTHKGSFSDCMPVWNESKDICLLFYGEEMTDESTIDALRSKGHRFNRDDASYIVHMYEEFGAAFFSGLNGIFSGLIVDLRRHKAMLFNDRYGLSRIHYHENRDGFYFASEAKALLKVLPELRSIDTQSFGEYFITGSALQNRTLFSGISLLPCGSAWVFQKDRPVDKETYFDKKVWEGQQRLPENEYYPKLFETLTRIMPKYFTSRQKLALSLTGGVDSRMIIATLRAGSSAVPCLTFGGLYRDCADVSMGRRVAQICKQPHELIELNKGFFTDFPNLAQQTVYLTDGAMDASGAVGLFVNRLFREKAQVRLTGNYGGEILRSLMTFRALPVYESMFSADFRPDMNKAFDTMKEEARDNTPSFIAFKQVPWHHYNRFALEQSQLTIRSPYLDNDLVALSYQAPLSDAINKKIAHRFITESNPDLAGLPTDRGIVSRASFLPFKVRQWLEEFLPRAEYCYDYGMPQWLARVDRITAPLHIEKLFLGRQKYYHYRIWYRNELSAFLKEFLLDKRTLSRPYLNGRHVEEMVSAHVSGRGNYTLEIHKLLSSEFIQRGLIEDI